MPVAIDVTNAATVPGANALARGGLSRRALCRTLDLIERRLGDRLTLADLADAAAVSRFHFARMFRISTGASPMDYLRQARVTRGKQLLAQRSGNIADLAATLGFCDQSHFARHFKRLTGVSPRVYASWAGPVAGLEERRDGAAPPAIAYLSSC